MARTHQSGERVAALVAVSVASVAGGTNTTSLSIQPTNGHSVGTYRLATFSAISLYHITSCTRSCTSTSTHGCAGGGSTGANGNAVDVDET